MLPWKRFSALAGIVIVLQFYQNCADLSSFQALDAGELTMGSSNIDHPGPDVVTSSSQKLLVHNKTYLASLVREVFTSSATPVPNLEFYINQWIFKRGGQYGQGCDPYGTHSGQDCGGSISNANAALQFEDNTLRESFRLQFCQNILGMDQAVYAVMEKIPHRSVAPTAASVQSIYQMFYRGDDAPAAVISTLMALDTELAKNNESVLNRWRAVSLQICESPGWQLQ